MKERVQSLRQLAICAISTLALLIPALVSAQEVQYYHLDAVGNVRVVTNQAGQVVERHDYLPFGEECTTGPCAADTPVGAGQPKHFTGKERDTETGLDYFGARYYRGNLGRFTTVDPTVNIKTSLLDPQRWNRYAYVSNNPLRYVDPDGREQPVIVGDRVYMGGLDGLSAGNNSAKNVVFGALVAGTLLAGAAAVVPELVTAATIAASNPQNQAVVQETLEGMAGGSPGGRGATRAGLEAGEASFLKSLGRAGRGEGIREVEGGVSDARSLFDRLRGENPVNEVKPGVFVSEGAQGGHVTFREASRSGPPTVDVHGVADGVRKIKFVGKE